MLDIFDRELSVGDLIAFNPPSYKGLRKGVIVAFTPKNVKIQYFDFSHDQRITWMSPKDVMKRTDWS